MASAAALVFAGKSVTIPAISFLVNKTFTYLYMHFKTDGVDEIKRRILLSLPKIQAVFDVVNPERIKEESIALDAWLWQLRDAIEEAEDALDEIEYYELEEKSKDRKVSDSGSSFAKIKHKAVRSVMQARIVNNTIEGLIHSNTLKRLRKALEGLDKAAAGVVDFLVLAENLKGCTSHRVEDVLNRDRETGSMLTETEVLGRHKEKKLVVGWLTKTSNKHTEVAISTNHVSVVSIVGHGGMGKTTLAQLLCQDDAITENFEQVIWVCVSTSFDATTVISKILESATWAAPDANSLDALQKILREKLNSVKFLLILDDVWEDKKIDHWKKLFAPLRAGRSGSKILLTARMQSVADLAAKAMGGHKEFLTLQGLEEHENIKLFNHHAFPGGSSEKYVSLQPIGEQIAKNVRVCPLVTKVVASHLQENLNSQYWNNFLRQRLEQFEGSADDIMSVLMLSYYHLPTELQTCFRYCSMFPQDYVFYKDKLVEMWMSSGLISQAPVGSHSLRDTGEQYLVQLIRKSFFEPRSTKLHHGQAEESGPYVMHDLMHDLASYVSLGECARIVDVAGLENVACTVRHVCVENIDILPVEKIKSITRLKNLRTIIIKDKYGYRINKVTLETVEELVERSKSLRLFQTELWHKSHFLSRLARLNNLRFIKLEHISQESICGFFKLYRLTTLDCRNVKIEPKQLRDVGNLPLVNINTLCISSFRGTRIPHWIAKPTVRNFVRLGVRSSRNIEELPALDKLVALKHLELEGLPMLKKIGQALDVSGDECIELLLPQSLQTLEVRHCSKLGELPLLPPNLKKLKIEDVGLTKLPGIGEPHDGNAETLSSQLEDITVEKCYSLKSLEGSFFEQKRCMAALHYLHIVNCVELESAPLPFEEMNGLREVVIAECPNLRMLRDADEDKILPLSVQQLIMGQCGDLELALLRSLQELTNLNSLELRKCSVLESLPSADVFECLKSLRWLKIIECENLLSLGGLGSLRFLYLLEITNCSKLAEAGLSLTWDVSVSEEEHLVVPRSALRIKDLHIDVLSLLLVEPLNSLCQTEHLLIWDRSEMESVPERWLLQNHTSLRILQILQADSLKSLPPNMRDLSSLKILNLFRAGQLRSLPDLPSSLEGLCIRGCRSELEKKVRKDRSSERNKISHVCRVEIGISTLPLSSRLGFAFVATCFSFQ